MHHAVDTKKLHDPKYLVPWEYSAIVYSYARFFVSTVALQTIVTIIMLVTAARISSWQTSGIALYIKSMGLGVWVTGIRFVDARIFGTSSWEGPGCRLLSVV